MASYRELYRNLGWDEARARRYQRLIELGLISKNCRLSPRDRACQRGQDAHTRNGKPTHGRLRRAGGFAGPERRPHPDALRRASADKNTLVLFLSDNGASDQAVTASLDKPGETGGSTARPRTSATARPSSPARRQVCHRRPAVGQRVEHALPPAQGNELRRRHLDAVDRLVAGCDHEARGDHARTRPHHGHHGHLSRRGGRGVSGKFNGRKVLPLAGRSLLPV